MWAPPYITHTKLGLNDGIGNMKFLLKYRAAASNPEHGNIAWLRAQLGDLGTFPILRGNRAKMTANGTTAGIDIRFVP